MVVVGYQVSLARVGPSQRFAFTGKVFALYCTVLMQIMPYTLYMIQGKQEIIISYEPHSVHLCLLLCRHGEVNTEENSSCLHLIVPVQTGYLRPVSWHSKLTCISDIQVFVRIISQIQGNNNQECSHQCAAINIALFA